MSYYFFNKTQLTLALSPFPLELSRRAKGIKTESLT